MAILSLSACTKTTNFSLWSPEADGVVLNLYNDADSEEPIETIDLTKDDQGFWRGSVNDVEGKFYTYNVKFKGEYLGETPGIDARAVSVNGRRGAIIDMEKTNPEGWDADVRPELKSFGDIIIYELHHRDFSIYNKNIEHKGKFLALTEEPSLEHLKELGVTHVHILPSFDFASVDETSTKKQYNWGYDPLNYNVPEGSYSTDANDPACRIREFKQMVQALHSAGIRVILDVVYNHTFDIENCNFQKTYPDYYYRLKEDGTYGNASGCGNETASEKEMMRSFMVESVKYWAMEYHVDGFRFDLMGVHDIETMNLIRSELDKIDPTIFVYGEGWAAEHPQLADNELALKANAQALPRIAVFSDELRDALRGPFYDDTKGGFLAGEADCEESIKFGIVGAVAHKQVDIEKVNYTDKFWATDPTQMISYVSCHDDMCLVDRLKASIPGIDEEELIRLDKLAQTAVFMSKGVPFILAGEEILRDKKGVHNSYCSPDSINGIRWNNKAKYSDVFEYYKGLIALRKSMNINDLEIQFIDAPALCVAYTVGENYVVILNANKETVEIDVAEGEYTILCRGGKIDVNGLGEVKDNRVAVEAQSATILKK